MKINLTQIYGIGILAFVLMLSTLIGVPVLPALSEELGAKTTEIPIVVSASLATLVVVRLFTGFLADRYSKRTLILTGALIGAVSSLLCAVTTDWRQLAFLRVAGGIADAIAMPALLAITASLGKEQPGKFFGILRSSQGLSFAVGPALGSVFSLVSLRTPFIADGVFSLVAALAASLLLKERDNIVPEHDIRLFSGISSVYSDKRIYLYLLMGISGLFGWGILSSFVPTQARIIDSAAWQIGLILFGGAAVFSLVSYIVGDLSDRFGRKIFVVLAQVIMVAAAIGLSRSNSFATLLVFYSLFCAGEAVTYLLCFVYASGAFAQKYIATSMGIFDSVIDLSLFLGPLIAISAFKAIGQITPIFLIAIIPAVFAFIFTAIWLPKDTKRKTY